MADRDYKGIGIHYEDYNSILSDSTKEIEVSLNEDDQFCEIHLPNNVTLVISYHGNVVRFKDEILKKRLC